MVVVKCCECFLFLFPKNQISPANEKKSMRILLNCTHPFNAIHVCNLISSIHLYLEAQLLEGAPVSGYPDIIINY